MTRRNLLSLLNYEWTATVSVGPGVEEGNFSVARHYTHSQFWLKNRMRRRFIQSFSFDYPASLDVLQRLLPKRVEPSGLGVRFDLAIPRVLEINLREFLQEFPFGPFVQLFHGFDDLRHGAHA